MLHDATQKDARCYALTEALHEACIMMVEESRAREKFMKRMVRRFPNLKPGDLIPNRMDGAVYQPGSQIKAARHFVEFNMPRLIEGLDLKHDLKEQEIHLIHGMRVTMDAVAVEGVSQTSFAALHGAVEYAMGEFESRFENDGPVKVLRQHVLRYGAHCIETLCCLEHLITNYQRQFYPSHRFAAQTPHQLAMQLWRIRHQNAMPGDQDQVAITNHALEIMQSLFEPYDAVLPETYSIGMLGIIGMITRGASQSLIANDNSIDEAAMLRLIPIRHRVMQTVSKIFSKFPQQVDESMMLDAIAATNNALVEMRRAKGQRYF